MKKLAIVITHPIQYYAPVFKILAKQCKLKVFYTWGFEGAKAKTDKGFKKEIDWDIPLLESYEYEFAANTAKEKGSHHFLGIKNPDLIQRIKDFKPDAILVYGWAYQSHLKVLRYFKGKVPVWFRGDSNLLDAKPLFKRLARKILLKWVYRYIDKAFYVGSANKAYFKAFGLKEHQLIFAPHAVDNDRFGTNRANEAQILRDKLGIADNDTLILFAGKLEQKKNPDLLLQAFLNSKADNTHLLFVGNGELEKSLKTMIECLSFDYAQDDIYGKVHFMDFQNQSYMPVVYQACDLFCLPSQGPNETWGLAVNEAMAAGKAVLVSDRVGCSLDLLNQKNGAVFNSDLETLDYSLKEIIQSDLKKLGQNSYRAIQNWSFEIQTNSIIQQLHEEN